MIQIGKEKATAHNVNNVDFETMGVDTLSLYLMNPTTFFWG
jgi:hypothetical protein